MGNTLKCSTQEKNSKDNHSQRSRYIPVNVKRETFNISNGHCFSCWTSLTFDDFHLGHIIPFRDGGSNTVDNLRALCRQCNQQMGPIRLEEWIAEKDLPGISYCSELKPDSNYYIRLGALKRDAIEKLFNLHSNASIGKTRFYELMRKISSRNLSDSERHNIINQIISMKRY